MSFTPKFRVGQTVSNEELYTEFKCANTGGMRRSYKTNSLVIICDHTKSLYDDKWHDGVLHYTGMGKSGDQSLEFAQNPTLNESDSNGVSVFLFEVMEAGRYTYRGPIRLAGEPYQDIQDDENGNPRKVWMFPIKTTVEQTITEQEYKTYIEDRQKKASKLSMDELRKAATAHGTVNNSSREMKSKVYIRDEAIAEYTKRSAKGICDLCEMKAPFNDKKGNPYLESHHIIWLSKGGPDTIDNTVALCPNCHKKMHIVGDQNDIEILKAKARKRNEEASH